MNLFPSFSCLICHTEINSSRYPNICDSCAGSLPMRESVGACINHAPFFYQSPIIELVLRLKYGAEGIVAEAVAPFMAEGFVGCADVIVPVPLSKKRLARRGYNQALLIARALSEIMHIKVVEAIIRVRDTVAQKNMSVSERQENLKGAFKVVKKSAVRGKRILLVDDVYTTGATARGCATVLEKAGASGVEFLTIASVN